MDYEYSSCLEWVEITSADIFLVYSYIFSIVLFPAVLEPYYSNTIYVQYGHDSTIKRTNAKNMTWLSQNYNSKYIWM